MSLESVAPSLLLAGFPDGDIDGRLGSKAMPEDPWARDEEQTKNPPWIKAICSGTLKAAPGTADLFPIFGSTPSNFSARWSADLGDHGLPIRAKC